MSSVDRARKFVGGHWEALGKLQEDFLVERA